jgi:peptide/nickel transport system ATP-binding protein
MNEILIENLNVWFGEHDERVDAVKGANLSIPKGGSFGLMGESGPGKSTILRAIMGLAPTWNGRMEVGGDTLGVKRTRTFYRKFQRVFQDPYASLHPRHSVDQVLSETLSLHGFKDIEARIDKMLTSRLKPLSLPYNKCYSKRRCLCSLKLMHQNKMCLRY